MSDLAENAAKRCLTFVAKYENGQFACIAKGQKILFWNSAKLVLIGVFE